MGLRKEDLITEYCYHIFNKSIAKYVIFKSETDYIRFTMLLKYNIPQIRHGDFSTFLNEYALRNHTKQPRPTFDCTSLVQIKAYCIMPTHFHLLLKQLKDNGISIYMQRLLNSYAKYFNIKHTRKGPLWQSRFKNVLVETEEQYLHLTRYIHLNPTSAGLVAKPEEWIYSSYHEYISMSGSTNRICKFKETPDFDPDTYRKFVEAGIEHQRDLAKIKKLILE
ncbi:MAG: transposase [Pseudomonadota bacterium]